MGGGSCGGGGGFLGGVARQRVVILYKAQQQLLQHKRVDCHCNVLKVAACRQFLVATRVQLVQLILVGPYVSIVRGID